MAEKLSKKELTEPDWLHTEFAKLSALLSHYRTQVTWIAGMVVFLIIAGSGWYLYRINYEKNAGQLYSRAQLALRAGDPALREKNALKFYGEVAAKYPRSRVTVLAYYRLGNLYYHANDMDRSIEAYRKLIDKTPRDSDLVTIAYSALGYCYEAKGDFRKALTSFEDALNSPAGKYFAAVNYRNMARIYEEMNNTGKAVEYYRKALEKSSDPGVNLLLKRKIATLG